MIQIQEFENDEMKHSGSRASATIAPRILMLAGDADNNLGDNAIMRSICRGLLTAFPSARICVITKSPHRVETFGAVGLKPGVIGLPSRLLETLRSDLVLCGGGGLFQDDNSLVKMPYWAVRLGIARLLCPRIVGISLGVGPLDATVSRRAAKLAFAFMERVSVRDAIALKTAQPLCAKEVQLVPDPALLLAEAEPQVAQDKLMDLGVPLDGRPLIGVAPRRLFPPKRRVIPHKIQVEFGLGTKTMTDETEALVDMIAQTLDQILKRHGGHVVFLPTYNAAAEADDVVCQAIASRMAVDATSIARIDDPGVYKAITRKFSVLLGGRMHPTIFASSVGTPVAGLAYNPKFFGFFELIGCERDCLDVHAFLRDGDVSKLVAILDRLIVSTGPSREVIEQLEASILDFATSLFCK